MAVRARRENLDSGGGILDGGEEGGGEESNGGAKVAKKDRVGMMDVGVYDTDLYSGDKSKFEGYHTTLAVDEGDEDETPLLGSQQQKRSTYTAPKAVMREAQRAGQEDDVDPFEAHR